jgi:hypothetical protein
MPQQLSQTQAPLFQLVTPGSAAPITLMLAPATTPDARALQQAFTTGAIPGPVVQTQGIPIPPATVKDTHPITNSTSSSNHCPAVPVAKPPPGTDAPAPGDKGPSLQGPSKAAQARAQVSQDLDTCPLYDSEDEGD